MKDCKHPVKDFFCQGKDETMSVLVERCCVCYKLIFEVKPVDGSKKSAILDIEDILQ